MTFVEDILDGGVQTAPIISVIIMKTILVTNHVFIVDNPGRGSELNAEVP